MLGPSSPALAHQGDIGGFLLTIFASYTVELGTESLGQVGKFCDCSCLVSKAVGQEESF